MPARQRLTFLDFFAGCGLATEGMRGVFTATWANDICPKKASIYEANHGLDHFLLQSVTEIQGSSVPSADLAWASFPCQDLSLAGKRSGLAGKRSSLVWEWLRVIDEMGARRPPLLVAENVSGLVTSHDGENYRALHAALESRGYHCGAMELNAVHWAPQSRPRIFVVAAQRRISLDGLCRLEPGWEHSKAIRRAATALPGFVWWSLPTPALRGNHLGDLLEKDAPVHSEIQSARLLALTPPRHRARLDRSSQNGFFAVPGYKRMRQGKQVLELRFDGNSGCLRTPGGGSSRQFLVLKNGSRLATRLLTVREAARLMGAPESYRLPGSYNTGYKAMGDAVAVPVVRFLAEHLLRDLATRSRAAP